MKMNRIVAGLVFIASAGFCLAQTNQAPPAKRPAPKPTTQPTKAKLGSVLSQQWSRYKKAWAGPNIEAQSAADAALVQAILKAPPAEVASLRDEMAAEYERLASAPKPDAFMQGRLAARLVVAWTRSPTGKEVSSAQLAVNRALGCRQLAHWATATLKHFGSGLPEEVTNKYGSFVPGSAVSAMSLMLKALPIIDNPADVRDELTPVRNALVALAVHSGAREAQTRQSIDKFYKSLESFAGQQPAKDAVRKLIEQFPTAYNGKDTKAFASLWPTGHPAVAKLKGAQLADMVPPDLWTISHWRCAYVIVQKARPQPKAPAETSQANPAPKPAVDLAQAFVVSQYTTKAGQAGGYNLQGFRAARNEKEGWKLD